jgi:hypothetical protein
MRESLEREFPKNYLFLQHYNSKQLGCDHPQELRKYSCADSQCQETQSFCFNCARKGHGNCQANAVFKSKKLSESVIFESKDVQSFLAVHEIKRSIEVSMEELKSRLFSFVEAVEASIAREGSLMTRSQESPEFFWQNKQLFSSKVKENSDKLFLELRNNAPLERLASKVSQEIRENVLPVLHAKVDASINSMVAEMLPELADLGHEKAKSVRETVDSLQKIDRTLLKGQLLHNFKGPARFSFTEYFGQLTSHLSAQSIVFTELDSQNFNDDQRATAKELVAIGFQKEAKSQESISKFIEERLNELYQPSNWRVRLSHLVPESRDIGDKRYLHLYRNHWHLIIREVSFKPRSLPFNAFFLDNLNQEQSEQPDLAYYSRSMLEDMGEDQYEEFEDSQTYYD